MGSPILTPPRKGDYQGAKIIYWSNTGYTRYYCVLELNPKPDLKLIWLRHCISEYGSHQ